MSSFLGARGVVTVHCIVVKPLRRLLYRYPLTCDMKNHIIQSIGIMQNAELDCCQFNNKNYSK